MAMTMSIPTIPGIPDFITDGIPWHQALNNKFVLYVPPKIAASISASSVLVLATRSANIPGYSIGTTTDNWFQYSFVYHNAQSTVPHSISFTFRGFMSPTDPYWILLEWMRKAVEIIPQANPLESYKTGAIDEYMSDAFLFLLTHSFVPFRIIKFVKIFPQSVGAVSLSYGAGSFISYSASFSFQWFEIIPLD